MKQGEFELQLLAHPDKKPLPEVAHAGTNYVPVNEIVSPCHPYYGANSSR